LDQRDVELDERFVPFELGAIESVRFVEVCSAAVALLDGLQVLLPPLVVGELDLDVRGFPLSTWRNADGDRQQDHAVRGLDAVSRRAALTAWVLDRVQVDED